MYHFYILRCADSTLYCGQTNNLKRRIEEHNFGKAKSAKYTKNRRPVKLIYHEDFKTLKKAIQREIEVKSWTKAKKDILVNSFFIKRQYEHC